MLSLTPTPEGVGFRSLRVTPKAIAVCSVVGDMSELGTNTTGRSSGLISLPDSLVGYLANDLAVITAVTARKPTPSGVGGSAYAPSSNPPTTVGLTPQHHSKI
jgi:hypothetical protein